MAKPRVKKEPFKLGQRRVATLMTFECGTRALFVQRSPRDLNLGKSSFISHAMTSGEAAWPVEVILLRKARLRGIELIGVHVAKMGQNWLSRTSDWVDKSRIINERTKNGSPLRYLKIAHFRHDKPAIKI
jgi:hypothetical protein